MSKLAVVKMSVPYSLIKSFYGDKVAERSRVPLINHINEGLEIMDKLGASFEAMYAFCLHPMLQNDHELIKNFDSLVALGGSISLRTIALTLEYRRAANAYLCTEDTDKLSLLQAAKRVGLLLPEIRHMLIADKQQNQKDFLLHHFGTHPRSQQLATYFENWKSILEEWW